MLQMTGDLQAGYLVCQVSATNAAGTGTALSNRYLVAQPDLGFHVNAMEITQGIQTPELPTRSGLNPFDETVSYHGVPLPDSSRAAGPSPTSSPPITRRSSGSTPTARRRWDQTASRR